MILSNRAKCLKCEDVIFSASVHDFKSCKCDNIFVDGGMDYIRHGWKDALAYKDLSVEVEDGVFKACEEVLEWCDDTGRNNLGRICAIFRVLKDKELI
jgi:hypothetical protein